MSLSVKAYRGRALVRSMEVPVSFGRFMAEAFEDGDGPFGGALGPEREGSIVAALLLLYDKPPHEGLCGAILALHWLRARERAVRLLHHGGALVCTLARDGRIEIDTQH